MELSNNQKKRTKKQAEKAGAITELPTRLALITLEPYNQALTAVQNEAAYLQPVTANFAANMVYENGKIYFQGAEMNQQQLYRYFDNDPKILSNINYPMLNALYTIVLQEVKQKYHLDLLEQIKAATRDYQYLNHSVKIYLPDLLKMIGYSPYSSTDEQIAILNQIKSFKNLLGIMTDIRSQIYPVMIFKGYNPENNTIEFFSPYFNQLILAIVKASIMLNRNNIPKLKNNTGKLYCRATHSYMVASSIVKERNKRAVLLLFEVVSLIERAGNNVPHIKCRTLIKRCPDLSKALENAKCSSDANKSLKRTFEKLWELLIDKTDLNEKYKHLKITKIIPTTTRLDYVLEFPHT